MRIVADGQLGPRAAAEASIWDSHFPAGSDGEAKRSMLIRLRDKSISGRQEDRKNAGEIQCFRAFLPSLEPLCGVLSRNRISSLFSAHIGVQVIFKGLSSFTMEEGG